jgi:photosystem II stability/assembly factor-like uncharacterized protein
MAGSSTLAVTTDGGQAWTIETLPPDGFELASDSTFYAPFACPSIGDCLVAGEAFGTDENIDGAIAQTTDGGTSWTVTTSSSGGQILGGGAFFGVVCPSSAECYASGTGFSSPGFAAVTTDGGGSWTTVTDPAGFITTCPATTTCYASGHSGIQESTDGGTTWAAVAAPEGFTRVSPLTCPSSADCYSVAIDPAQYQLMAATTNGAQTWQTQTTPRGVFAFADISCGSSQDCYALSSTLVVGSGGSIFINGQGAFGSPAFSSSFYASPDGGTTWNVVNLPAGDSLTGGVKCPSADACYLPATDSSGQSMLKTTDGGSTWTSTSVPSGDVLTGVVACPSTDDCYATAFDSSNNPVIVASTDGGATWVNEAVPSGIGILLAVACPSTTSCFVTATSSSNSTPVVIATTDGGSTWSQQTLPSDATNVGAIACPSVTTCYVAGLDSDASNTASWGALLLTTNGGTTWSDAWSQQTVPSAIGIDQPNDVACYSTTACVALGFDTAIATSDGGASWTQQTLPTGVGETSALSCPSSSQCLIAGQGIGDVAALVLSGSIPPTISTTSLPGGTFGSS